MKQCRVVLVYKGKNLSSRYLPTRYFDRVPVVGETIIFGKNGNEFLYVKEVFWREDGSASLLLGDEK